ncbi:putative cytoplasm protein [Meredithblackwellia eburnea MCA 4105]
MTAAAASVRSVKSYLGPLRQLMKQHSVQCYICASEDSHSSEYTAQVDKRREWLTGFTGSAGTAVVCLEEAHLFTDGRYHQQAAKELSSEWTLQKYGVPDVKNWQDWLTTLPTSTRIGLDPTLLPISDYNSLVSSLSSSNKATLVPIPTNLVDQVWESPLSEGGGGGKPQRPTEGVRMHEVRYAGMAMKDKVEAVRKEVRGKKAWGVVVSMLDEICWTLNLRGSDIPFNPVFFSYLVIPVSSPPTLFINIDKLSKEVYEYLEGEGVLIEPYESVVEYLEGVAKGFGADDKMIVPHTTNLALSLAVGLDKIDVVNPGPIGLLKAVKNATEIEGFRQSHLRDGVALTRYFSWLDRQLSSGGTKLTETEAANKLEELRSSLPLFQGLSFPTISSTGPNASVIHYQPPLVGSSVVEREAIYLCDSGAQFLDGTTDTTRTLHFGTPKPEEIRAYTRVLQGHIAIDQLIFPATTTGYILDAFARRALWEDGLDYRHGTGHGVGSFLNVHEGPHGIGTRLAYNNIKLKAGFTVSNEPGYYEEGKFGIRIENVVIVKRVERRNDFGGVGWLGFEHVTMVPIQTKLVDPALLNPKELKWLNDYNLEVRTKLTPLIEETGDKEALEWLREETKAISASP